MQSWPRSRGASSPLLQSINWLAGGCSSRRTSAGLGPRTDDPDRLLGFYNHYMDITGGSYWSTPVGDGNRTAQACFGRLGCQQAYKYLTEHPDDAAGAKKIAATYCLHNLKRCGIDQGQFDAISGGVKVFHGIRPHHGPMGAGGGRNRPYKPESPELSRRADGTGGS